MTDYIVRFDDGPAGGWVYETGLEPPGEIALAPNAPELVTRFGPWTRVLVDRTPYEGQVHYRRERFERAHGRVVCHYEFEN